MRMQPYLTATVVAKATGLSMPTVNTALAHLQSLGLVREVTGRKRGRVFAYQGYLNILSDGATG